MVEFRTISGFNNNLDRPNWGKTEARLRRILSAAYEDSELPRGIVAGEPGNPFIGTSELPNPREISNAIANQTESVTNYLNASNFTPP